MNLDQENFLAGVFATVITAGLILATVTAAIKGGGWLVGAVAFWIIILSVHFFALGDRKP